MNTISKIGAHVSIAGGIQEAPHRAKTAGCETFQCFTRSPQGGPAPKLTDEVLELFKSRMQECDIKTFYIHAPYYINLASLNEKIRQSSIRVIKEELERGSLLGAGYVMTHVGSHTDQTMEAGLARTNQALLKILDGYSGTTKLLIEISAGAGSVIGDTFEEVGEMVGAVKDSNGFGGVCFDTCHAFASGYDYRTPSGLADVLQQFDANIGLDWLKLTHVNDSKADLGGKKDRHEHIGHGFIGRDGIASILSSPPFARIDWLLETAEDGRESDIQILREIRKNG